MSTVKQEVFQETGTYEVNAPATFPTTGGGSYSILPKTTVPTNSAYSSSWQNNYFLTDYADRTVVPPVEDKTNWSVEYANQGAQGGAGPGHPFTRIPGMAPYTTAYDTSSKLTLNIGYHAQDLRKAGPNGLGADRCVVRIAGKYSLGILVSPYQKQSGLVTTSNTQFRYWYNNATGTQIQGTPVNMSITNLTATPHNNPGDPSNQYVKTAPTPFEMTSDRWTNTIEPVATGDIAVNTIQAGSATSHGDIKQTDNLEFIIEIENTTPLYNTVPGVTNEYFVIPYTNGIPNVYYETRNGQNYTNHIYYRGSYTLGWEGNLHTIDDLDGDSVVFTTPTSTMVVAAFTRVDMDPEELTDNFTVTEATAVRKFGSAGLSSQATVSASAKSTKFITETITAITNLDATTENFVRMDPKNLTATSSVSVTPTYKPTALSDMSHTATVSTFAGMIYDITTDYSWNTFNLNTYFVTGFVDDEFVSQQGEYNWNFIQSESWDSWPTITWIGNESNWDNWPDDVWEKTYKVNTIGSMLITPSFKIGDIVEYNGVFTVTEDVALNEPGEADLVANITIDATASGVISISAEEITAAFTPSLTANITYDLQDNEVTITGAFTPVLTANAITDTFADIDVSASMSITPSFKPAGFSTITAATDTDLSPTFKPAGLAALTASAGTLTVARMFFQTDPYNIFKVQTENRVVMVPTENRQTLVMEENRVNIVGAETRAHLVPQETRNIKLRVPPITNRFTIPRVRSEV